MKTDKLFVYGSLMSGIQSPIAIYLKSNSEFLGEGFVQGRLHDIGKYPGLVFEPNTASRVVGHIFQLDKPIEMLPKLDFYECVGAGFIEPNEYRRTIIPVHFENRTIECWAYLWNSNTANLKQIISGNYLTYFEQNPRYQRFVKSLHDFSRH